MGQIKRRGIGLKGLRRFILSKVREAGLHPRGIWLHGGFAKGYGKHEKPDIDLVVVRGVNEESGPYFEVLEGQTYRGYPIEVHLLGLFRLTPIPEEGVITDDTVTLYLGKGEVEYGG